MVWPQVVGLLFFVSLWMCHPGGQGFIPWAKPVAETPGKAPPAPAPVKEPAPPPVVQQPAEMLAPCKSGQPAEIIQACTSLLASGNLRAHDILNAYWHRGAACF